MLSKDIVVVGGGVAGLVASIAFARAGFETLCIEPAPAPARSMEESGADLRSTAFLEPSIALMEEAGIWPRLAPFATDLATMRLADAGGPDPAIRQSLDFNAAEIGQPRFGANIANWVLRRELMATLEETEGAEIRLGEPVARAHFREREIRLALAGGDQIRAALAIAADGRGSFMAEAAGIAQRRWTYGQKALVLAASHPLPHQNVSTEIHRSGGPFTLVPLADQAGVPHSAIVWMERSARAAALLAMSRPAFTEALNARACDVLGPLAPASWIASWPIISQLAGALTGQRLALIAEAAHVVPPIGAQGLNMSLKDIAVLCDLVREARDRGGDIGSDALLGRYARQRRPEIAARVAGIHALNLASMAESQTLRDLRNRLLQMVGGPGMRQAAMRAGLA